MIHKANFYLNYKEKRFLKNLRPLSTYSRIIHGANFGRGVEATSLIPECSLIGVYPGQSITIKTLLEKEEFVNKSIKCCFLHPNNSIVDPTDIFGYLQDTPSRRIAFINEPISGVRANTISVSSRSCIWYLTIREIKTGEQLFTNYGYSYKRDYETSVSDEENSFDNPDSLNVKELSCLKSAAVKYSWLKYDLAELLEKESQ